MAIRRRAVPFVLVGALTALALGAAAVSLITGPSPDQIALEVAAQQTAAAEEISFTYAVTFELPPPFHPTAQSAQGRGVWHSPDAWSVTTEHDGSSSTFTGRGATMEVTGPGPDIHPLTFTLPSGALASFSDPNAPVLSLPPLGLLSAATNVVRSGDTYHFEVPHLSLGLAFGWVAYAPLSRATLPLSPLVARNVRVDVVINDGDVATLAFPRGIRATGQGHTETERVAWRITRAGPETRRK